MKLQNNYIFLSKNEELLGGSALNNLWNLGVGKSINDIFKEKFTLINGNLMNLENEESISDEQFQEILDGLEKYTYLANNDNDEFEFMICINKVLSMAYCSIEVAGNKKSDLCSKMEFLNNFILTNDELNENNIIICSYDSVSEYYCNKIYSKLNKFERLLRKLMLNIYTVNLKNEYYEKTIPQEISNNMKKNVGHVKGKDKNELRIQESFYNLTLDEVEKILFTKTWNSYDQENIEKFLKKNKDLTKIDDETLRRKFKEIKPKSDWERFFGNKGLDDDFNTLLDDIREYRNKVAHAKFLSSNEYNIFNKKLNKMILSIKKSIEITETVDFKEKNKEYLNEISENIKNAVQEFSRMLSEKVKPILSEGIRNMGKFLNSLIDRC